MRRHEYSGAMGLKRVRAESKQARYDDEFYTWLDKIRTGDAKAVDLAHQYLWAKRAGVGSSFANKAAEVMVEDALASAETLFEGRGYGPTYSGSYGPRYGAQWRFALAGPEGGRWIEGKGAHTPPLRDVLDVHGWDGPESGAMGVDSYGYDPSMAMGTATFKFDLDTEHRGVSGWWVVGGILGGLALGSVVGLVMSVEAVSQMTPDERTKAFGPGGGVAPAAKAADAT